MGKNKNLRLACDIFSENILQILMIDLNSEEIEELKISGNIASYNDQTNFGGFVDELIKNNHVYGDDINIYLENMDINFLKKYFKTNLSLQFRYRHFINNDYKFVNVQMIKSNDYSSKFQIIYAYVIDIDDIQSHEQELIDELKEVTNLANNANKSKTEFLSRMSHDIRNPLNVVLGMTTLCKRIIEDKDSINKDILTDYLNKIDNSTEYLLSLVNDTLEVSKIENNKIELKYSYFDIDDIFYNIIDSMKINFNNQIINYNSNIIHKTILADKSRLQQIINNLLSNSCKYNIDNNPINIKLIEENIDSIISNYKIIIEDNGMGMNQELIDRLFIPYERGIDARINKISGSGLGMSIVKKLIDIMNGNIIVESEEGVGSVFTITIPFEHILENEISFNYDALKNKNVLVVEDYDINQFILGEFLKPFDINCDYASDGNTAVTKVLNNSYDAVLMDIRMPIMDGYEATKLIREKNHDVPIIAISADAFEEDIIMMNKCGMTDHIAKPIEQNKLLFVLSKYM